jgi:hypothetical protein
MSAQHAAQTRQQLITESSAGSGEAKVNYYSLFLLMALPLTVVTNQQRKVQ